MGLEVAPTTIFFQISFGVAALAAAQAASLGVVVMATKLPLSLARVAAQRPVTLAAVAALATRVQTRVGVAALAAAQAASLGGAVMGQYRLLSATAVAAQRPVMAALLTTGSPLRAQTPEVGVTATLPR